MNDLLLAGPEHLAGYLLVGALLFALGILAVAVRRNALGFLMGLELMLNASALNFAAFCRFHGSGGQSDGQVMSLFIIALAAAEAAVALALAYQAARTFGDINLAKLDTLKT